MAVFSAAFTGQLLHIKIQWHQYQCIKGSDWTHSEACFQIQLPYSWDGEESQTEVAFFGKDLATLYLTYCYNNCLNGNNPVSVSGSYCDIFKCCACGFGVLAVANKLQAWRLAINNINQPLNFARMKHFYIFLYLIALVTPVSSFATERFFLQVPVKTDPSAPVTAKIRSECALEMLLENYALSGISNGGLAVESITSPEQAGANKVIELTILSAHGFGGGNWSGPKSMSVRAEVKKEGAVLNSTVLMRSSRGGVFGGMVGTCAILDRVANVLGKDLALWLKRGSAAQPSEANSSVPASTDQPEAASAK